MQDQYVYKIFRPDEWAALQNTGAFTGSADDLRDGFIHLSAAHQVRGTLDAHYGDVGEIVLARVDTTGMADELKWETSRGGEPFPHLYADLSFRAVQSHIGLVQSQDNRYQVPDNFLLTAKP